MVSGTARSAERSVFIPRARPPLLSMIIYLGAFVIIPVPGRVFRTVFGPELALPLANEPDGERFRQDNTKRPQTVVPY